MIRLWPENQRFTPDDITVKRITRRSVPEGWGLWLPQEERGERLVMIFAEEDDTPLAVFGVFQEKERGAKAYSTVAVNPSFRGQGLLKLAYLVGMRVLGLTSVLAYVDKTNTASFRGHLKIGTLIDTCESTYKYLFEITEKSLLRDS